MTNPPSYYESFYDKSEKSLYIVHFQLCGMRYISDYSASGFPEAENHKFRITDGLHNKQCCAAGEKYQFFSMSPVVYLKDIQEYLFRNVSKIHYCLNETDKMVCKYYRCIKNVQIKRIIDSPPAYEL